MIAIVDYGMGNLRSVEKGFLKVGVNAVVTNKPDIIKNAKGVVLLHVLFSESEEFGRCRGLDIFKGKVVRFRQEGLKVPHMGWNEIRIQRDTPLLDRIPDKSYLYFVHSFYVVPEDRAIVSTTTDYGIEFTSMIHKGNVFATQFHPEKSQKIGLTILENFGKVVAES
ncbi:MAG: imidazole glycerol phosphate synthase subunit HisH [Nitrospirae bacterium]|nr:imidazole glycerol phosphate synthase subunit HisH [Nitrospirota bacterium]